MTKADDASGELLQTELNDDVKVHARNARIPLYFAWRKWAWVFAVIGLAFGVVGCLAEYVISFIPALKPLARFSANGWPPLAPLIVSPVIGAMVGTTYGAVLIMNGRGLVAYLADPQSNPLDKPKRSWWVRLPLTILAVWAVEAVIGAVVLLIGAWWHGSMSAMLTGVSGSIAAGAGFGAFVGSVLVAVDILTRHTERHHSWAGRIFGMFWGAVGTGFVCSFITALASIPLAYLGVTPVVSFGMAVAIAGWMMVYLVWEIVDTYPRPRRAGAAIDMRAWREPFWDREIEPESSIGGVDEHGYPFFMWRESADNRLGVGRARYCCIRKTNGTLQFAFCDPWGAARSNHAWEAYVFSVAVGSLGLFVWFTYFDHSEWLGAGLVAVITSVLVGSVVPLLVYVTVMLLRWWGDRYAGDSKVYEMPWDELTGFSKLPAALTGATQFGDPAKTGEGLAAIFSDGTEIILTRNPWKRDSIIEFHKLLTQRFAGPEAARMRREFSDQQRKADLMEALRQAAQPAHAPASSGVPTSKPGVPDTL